VLTVKVHSLFDVPVLRCSGRIVRGDETALLCAAVQQQKRAIILDLTEVEAIDAAGIGLLVTLQAAGFYLTLMNPTAQVRDTLRVTKVDSILEISEFLSPETLLEGIPANA